MSNDYVKGFNPGETWAEKKLQEMKEDNNADVPKKAKADLEADEKLKQYDAKFKEAFLGIANSDFDEKTGKYSEISNNEEFTNCCRLLEQWKNKISKTAYEWAANLIKIASDTGADCERDYKDSLKMNNIKQKWPDGVKITKDNIKDLERDIRKMDTQPDPSRYRNESAYLERLRNNYYLHNAPVDDNANRMIAELEW